jgi:hypothetical protein
MASWSSPLCKGKLRYSEIQAGSGAETRLPSIIFCGPGRNATPRFFHGLPGVTTGYLFVPGWMMGPGPGFADCALRHGLDCAGLADCAEVNVNKDAGEHDQRRDVVDHIADGDGRAAENLREPHDQACDEIRDAAADDFPEL